MSVSVSVFEFVFEGGERERGACCVVGKRRAEIRRLAGSDSTPGFPRSPPTRAGTPPTASHPRTRTRTRSRSRPRSPLAQNLCAVLLRVAAVAAPEGVHAAPAPGMSSSSMRPSGSGIAGSTIRCSPSESRPSSVRRSSSGAPVAQACGLQAVGYSTGIAASRRAGSRRRPRAAGRGTGRPPRGSRGRSAPPPRGSRSGAGPRR